MHRNKNKKVGIIGVIITILILIFLVLLTNINTSKTKGVENIFHKLVMPIQNGLTYLKNKMSNNNVFFEDINNLKKENARLLEEKNQLEEKLNELELIKAENATLREYNNMSEKYSDYTTIPAYIINKDISNISQIFVINVGTDDGVYENMAVISTEGLVGYTISATKNTAKVKPIIDPSNSTSAVISTSRESVVLRGMLGKDDELRLMYIPTDADILMDDVIETSGIGGIYPKGIIIGKISQIIESKNITDRYAIVKTAVDFSKLETVLVIKK